MNERIILKTAGHTLGNLVCDGIDTWCGDITHGLALCFTGDHAGFVVSFEDWEKVYLLAKELRDKGLLTKGRP
jgi:hypothetical protein